MYIQIEFNMNEEKLYLHKLINQRKRFVKWDIADEYKQEYLELIDRQIAIEKEKSKKRKEDYSCIYVECANCSKRFERRHIYLHHRSCFKDSDERAPKPIVSENQDTIYRQGRRDFECNVPDYVVCVVKQPEKNLA